MRLQRLLIPFQSRNYRLYFGGQIVSLVGTWMTQTTTVWLVYQLTNSPAWLGWVAFASQMPMVLMAPVAGVWVDRLDRKRLLLTTQVLAMFQVLTLALLTLTNWIQVWMLCVLALVQGVITSFDLPARQTLAVMMVEKKEHLPAVIGMNSSMFNIARLCGPALAGFLIATVGPGFCYLADGISYIAVLAAIANLRLPQKVNTEKRVTGVWHEMTLGLRYVWHTRPIRTLILVCACISAFGLSFAVLIPVYAREMFAGDARTLGYLMSSSAAGSLIAALYLASRHELRGIGNVMVVGGFVIGCALLAFANSRFLPVSMICLLFAGLGGILIVASNNSLVQTLVDEDKRGRVMSLYGMAFLGGMPIGSLIAGNLANYIGISAMTMLNGAACLVMTFLFWKNLPRLREESMAMMENAPAREVK